MRTVRRLPVLIAMLLGCTEHPIPAIDPDVARVDELITKKGAHFVLDSEFRDDKFESLVDDHIATGDSAWLEIARRLNPSADAGPGEALETALAFAIAKAPERALRLLSDSSAKFAFAWVCRPYQSLNDADSLAQAREDSVLRASQLAALATVRSTSMIPLRDSCARSIGNK